MCLVHFGNSQGFSYKHMTVGKRYAAKTMEKGRRRLGVSKSVDHLKCRARLPLTHLFSILYFSSIICTTNTYSPVEERANGKCEDLGSIPGPSIFLFSQFLFTDLVHQPCMHLPYSSSHHQWIPALQI